MEKAVIQLKYRQVIDHNTEDFLEKMIFQLSYDEFKLKSQVYNPEQKLTRFSQMKAIDGRANSLHYKSGFAVSGYLESLNKAIPGFANEAGQPVLFESYRFEVIESDITDISKHQVAVHYITGNLSVLGVLGDKLLLAYGNRFSDALPTDPIEDCFLLALPKGVTINRFHISVS
ncbi:hypothetical protein [Sediminibacterium goheungense]|uniref:Uncharacterized protein n=1 Tax=Sediminibacterium goheungense TaxID=1086393 RepID=A0A4R6J1Q3_9BACT|nr:hypothetical protein [Sediminibacterium goheungense]TDO29190.1 hypothetical protein BC659_1273 [Sediminibacterium goheungense]